MLLMVSASAAISPFASTVSFCFRSPFATAVTTFAMPRTWSVRLPAMKFTESVRSFHVPDTPSTTAWPPSLPSVPTSRATRVTSAANDESWSTIVLMVFFSSRISPFTSTVIFFDRSPLRHRRRHLRDVAHLARQVRGHGVHRVGQVLPRAGDALHVAPGRRVVLRCPPRAPRASPPRRTSESWSTIVLMVFFSSRISPFTSTVIFFDRSPFATAVVTSAMLRTWRREVRGHRVHRVGQVLPRAGHTLHVAPGRRACLRCPLRAPRASLRRRTSAAGPPSC